MDLNHVYRIYTSESMNKNTRPLVGSNSSRVLGVPVLAILKDKDVKLTDGAANFLSSTTGILHILRVESLPSP
jgi:hypothetical protein